MPKSKRSWVRYELRQIPFTNAKNGVSSCEVARTIAVTQETAWFVLHRIREAMKADAPGTLSGLVEVDEAFIGGLEKNKHKSKRQHKVAGAAGTQIEMGILHRGTKTDASKMRAKVISDTTRETLHTEIKANVEPGAQVMTGAHRGYRGLSPV